MVKKMDTNSTVPVAGPSQPPPESLASAPGGAVTGNVPTPGFLPLNFPDLTGILLMRPPKFPVGTTVPERVYRLISNHREGISAFIEEAINTFNGDLRALVVAAEDLAQERKTARFDTGVRSISGRVPKAALTRLQDLVAALKGIPGMSLAKVLGGLVQIHLIKESK